MLNKKKNNLRSAYIVGLCLIAAMTIGTYFLMVSFIKQDEAAGTYINISGKQRMYAQKITVLSYRLVTSNISDRDQFSEVKSELSKTVEKFEAVHSALIFGNDKLGLQRKAPESVYNIYYKDQHLLDKKVELFVGDVKKLLQEDISALSLDNVIFKRINEKHVKVLEPLLDRVVLQYQKETERFLNFLHTVEVSVLFAVLALLLFEAFFLFRPLVNQVEADRLKLKQQTQRLRKAYKKSESSAQLKSEFLASMSHEIRTPMNGVIGMANLLLETNLNDTQRNYTTMAVNSAEHLLQLVNDILDFSKIEAGKIELEIIPFDLQQLVEEIADLVSVKAQERKIEVLLRFSNNMPRYVLGDPGRVRQIFINLTSNALKFTESGYISIELDYEDQGNDLIKFKAFVKDTGIGIPSDKLHYIFTKFSQADQTTTREFGGTGLGLSICRELTDMMGGEVGVESELEKGSDFWFTFNLERNTKEEKKALKSAVETSLSNIADMNILSVNNNAVAQNIIKEQLSAKGIKYSIADTAAGALDVIRDSKTRYDVVLLDDSLPDMMAEDMVKVMKSDKSLKAIPILLMASIVNKNKIDQLQSLNISGCLTKPVCGQDVVGAIAMLQNTKEKSRNKGKFITRHMVREIHYPKDNRSEEYKHTTFNGAQILLVEDNATNQMVAAKILEQLKCYVTPAGNGKEALKLINQQDFDLIFMDCNMPEMDGFEASREIRAIEKQSETKRHIPIVALTAYAMKGDDEKCYAAGMDEYITKPVNRADIIEALSAWISHKKRVVDGEGYKSNQESVEDDIVNVDHKTHLNNFAEGEEEELFDKKQFDEIQDLMGDKFKDFLKRYMRNTQAIIDQAKQAIKDNDAEELHNLTHKLKSSSASLGAYKLSHKANRIEQMSVTLMEQEVIDLKNFVIDINELEAIFIKNCDLFTHACAKKISDS